jgi:hypothetical protein
MDTTRRGFFRLAVGAAAVAALPVPFKAAADVPMIWADGIHNDAPGLNALIRGEVVQFFRPELADKIGWRGDTLDFGGQWFRCEETVVFEHDEKVLANMKVETTAKTALFARGVDSTISGIHLNCRSNDPDSVGLYIAAPKRPFVPDGPSAYCLTYGGE